MLAYPCIVCGRLTAQLRCPEHRAARLPLVVPVVAPTPHPR